MQPIFCTEDCAYILTMRRELHCWPELGYDLPRTTALVKRELDRMDIPWTDTLCQSSVVATLRPDLAAPAIAIRADMDALPVEEKTGLPFASRIPGRMHACGHDAHTAILLGTARVLKRMEKELPCRVKLIFQPNEEGSDTGGMRLTQAGAVDDVALILGLHADPEVAAGHIGITPGAVTTARHRYEIEFFGKTAHAAKPQTGRDALAMAVLAYDAIELMQTRQIDPQEKYLCCIGALNAGEVDNVVPDYARMLVSVRTFDLKLDAFICTRIQEIADGVARQMGGTARVTHHFEALPVVNDPALCREMHRAVTDALGAAFVVEMPVKMWSEDFSYYLEKVPGCFVGMGVRNEALDCTSALHSNYFRIDESGLINGCKVFVQFVMNYRGQEVSYGSYQKENI